VTNLSKVNDIPFNDSLHCYLVALKGFELLFKSYGYFEVFESMFHICQKGKLKIWCNQNIYKSVPEQYLLGEGREEDMVLKIINIIDNNTDKSVRYFSMKSALLRERQLNFADTILAFRRICRENRFTISEYLESLQNSSQIESMLDIYVPQENKDKGFVMASETGLTFNPNPKSQTNINTISVDRRRRSSTNSRRTRIFPERGHSADTSQISENRPTQIRIALAEKEADDGFPQFSRRKSSDELANSRSRHTMQRPLSGGINPRVKESSLKKRGPKEVPRYPEKIIYESSVNRISGDTARTLPHQGQGAQ
jgi:hypothetical protein